MQKDLSWKTLKSEYVLHTDWFTVRKDRCEAPGSKIIDPYYVFECPDWANAVPFTRDGHIILIRQYRQALGETTIEIPGGVIESTDADPKEGMKRELLEETGFAFDTIEDLGEISPNPAINNNLTYMYLAKGGVKVQDQHLDPNEDIEVSLYTPEEVVTLLKEQKIRQSLHVTCLFYALLKMNALEIHI